jgi:hypothetical protein
VDLSFPSLGVLVLWKILPTKNINLAIFVTAAPDHGVKAISLVAEKAAMSRLETRLQGWTRLQRSNRPVPAPGPPSRSYATTKGRLATTSRLDRPSTRLRPRCTARMATLQGSSIPKVKLEGPPDTTIKHEPTDTPSPFPNEDDDMYEDAGDVDFSQVQQQIWLSHVPRTLWEKLSTLQDDDEIEIGRVRVEGPETSPSRVRVLPCLCA